jgi:WD40 repeat protein
MEHGDAPFHFSADERRMATQPSENTVEVYDLATFAQWKRIPVTPGMEMDGFHPDGRRLMFKDPSLRKLRLIDIERSGETWSHVFETEVGGVVWRGDGRLFAVSGADHRIYVWDPTGDRLQSVLEGHQNTVVGLHFTHAGDLLLSTSWDGTIRVWDPIRGTCLLTAQAGLIRIGSDDRLLAVREDIAHLGIWELADGRECRTLHHGMVGNRTPRPENWGPNALDFSPDGRLLASSDTDGVRLWDPATGEHLAHLPIDTVGSSARFSPDSSHLMTLIGGTDRKIRIWPFRAAGEETEVGFRIGPPRFLGTAERLYSGHYYWDSTGRYVMLVDYDRNGAVLYDIVKSREVFRLASHHGLNQCPISPDGRWVATATWKGKDVKVWEVATGRLVWQLPCDSANIAFSPNGRWLAVIEFPNLECRLWRVGSWQPGPTIHLSRASLSMAFSRDGGLFAIDDAGRVRLVNPDSGRDVATLEAGAISSGHFYGMTFSPDGTYLAGGRDHIIHLWDLRKIRDRLMSMNLDWDQPAYAPAGARRAPRSVTLVTTPERRSAN